MLNFRRFAVVGLVATIFCSTVGRRCVAAKKRSVIRRLSFDKTARDVKLFEGIANGELTSRVAVKDETTSSVYIHNETDEPLTVELPDAVAAVHVLKQLLPQIGGTQNQGPNQLGGGGNGQSQAVGGQLGSQGNQGVPGGNSQVGNGINNGSNPGVNGFFSIPPEATVALKLNSVCLEHGKKTPTAGMKYELRPVETVAGNKPDLINLLSHFDLSKKNRKAVQAAAWHLASKMSWDRLRTKQRKLLGQPVTRWFTKSDLESAQAMVVRAQFTADSPKGNVGSRRRVRTATAVD